MATAIAKTEEAPVPQEGATILGMIDRVMAMPDVPVEKVAQLFELHERMQAEQAKRAFNVALNAAQAAMEPIRKDLTNEHTKSDYASYEAIDGKARPIYTSHGFSVSYNTGDGAPEGHIMVTATLSHSQGHDREYKAPIPCDGRGAKGGEVMTKTHAMGSAFSYGQRYLLKMIFNLAVAAGKAADDDGNGAAKRSAHDPISQAQLDELLKLADDVGADKARFCKFYNIASFADITVASFDKAKAALNAKRKK